MQDKFAIGWTDHLGPLWSVGKRLNKYYFISKPSVIEGRNSMMGQELQTNKGRQADAHETTIPLNRDPTLSSLIKPSRASFLPEHRRGSQ
jgi:hypothetical protein